MNKTYKHNNPEFREYVRNLSYYIPPSRKQRFFIHRLIKKVKPTPISFNNYSVGTIHSSDLTVIEINNQERIKGAILLQQWRKNKC